MVRILKKSFKILEQILKILSYFKDFSLNFVELSEKF